MDRVLPTAARSSCRRTETTRLAVDCGAGGLLARSLDEEAESVIRQWRIDHEGVGLNPFCTMRDPLGRTFRLRRLAWHPYLYWDLAADVRVPRDQEGEIARRFRRM